MSSSLHDVSTTHSLFWSSVKSIPRLSAIKEAGSYSSEIRNHASQLTPNCKSEKKKSSLFKTNQLEGIQLFFSVDNMEIKMQETPVKEDSIHSEPSIEQISLKQDVNKKKIEKRNSMALIPKTNIIKRNKTKVARKSLPTLVVKKRNSLVAIPLRDKARKSVNQSGEEKKREYSMKPNKLTNHNSLLFNGHNQNFARSQSAVKISKVNEINEKINPSVPINVNKNFQRIQKCSSLIHVNDKKLKKNEPKGKVSVDSDFLRRLKLEKFKSKVNHKPPKYPIKRTKKE